MASKQIRLTSTHKMALRMAIRMFEKKRMFIEAGELNDILEKSEGIKTTEGQTWKGTPAQHATNRIVSVFTGQETK